MRELRKKIFEIAKQIDDINLARIAFDQPYYVAKKIQREFPDCIKYVEYHELIGSTVEEHHIFNEEIGACIIELLEKSLKLCEMLLVFDEL